VNSNPLFADIALPTPLDRLFTYSIPPSFASRAARGSRATVSFGSRRLTGVILNVHSTQPEPGLAVKDIFRILDDAPVLDENMLSLAKWIAGYYCSPIGEVLRAMTPLTGEIRRSRYYSLTQSGRTAVRQLLLGTSDEEPSVRVLRLLEVRALSGGYIEKKVPGAKSVLAALVKKGLLELEDTDSDRDPLRSPSARLRAEFKERTDLKLPKAERELLSYLELHPGSHNLAVLEETIRNASTAARSLARRSLITLRGETPSMLAAPRRAAHDLNPHQQAAYLTIRAAMEAVRFETFLLHGVTGSGKTEVYMRLIDAALELGRGTLLLVPEIGLTPAVAGQFFHRFGDRVAILHSAFTDTERAEQWRRIRRGEAPVVVATRSGVFAPVANLGLILVDEEHDASYKQEETPRYHGRDVAIVRARSENAAIVLGSATPSLESRYNAEKAKYTYLELPERVESRPMPSVDLVDMRQEFVETKKTNLLSRALIQSLRERLVSGEQSMILMNRRGFSSFVNCRACGQSILCANCAVTLTWHRRDKRLLCHYCGYAERVPEACPNCSSEHLYFLGAGSERLEDELHAAFPEARIGRMDRDTVTGRRDYERFLYAMRSGELDILAGTQMIAKGHDIPNVTFVGIVNADIGLAMPDFRAAERCFQLLTQASGRAGRGTIPGRVLIQTLNPEHYAIRFAAAQDYAGFYRKEIEFRSLMRYPPFAALANVLFRAPQQEEALRLSSEAAQFFTPPPEGVKVLGPAEAPVPKLKQEFRYQMLLKTPHRTRLNELLRALRRHAEAQKWPATSLVIDVDPHSLM
jgi:primosomal protein N' (replication factor Y) (superfamily II helicase)